MERSLREQFNKNFTEERYKAYMDEIEGLHPGSLDFRNAETPIFINKEFKNKMLGACEDIIDVITAPNFKQLIREVSRPSPKPSAHSKLANHFARKRGAAWVCP